MLPISVCYESPFIKFILFDLPIVVQSLSSVACSSSDPLTLDYTQPWITHAQQSRSHYASGSD